MDSDIVRSEPATTELMERQYQVTAAVAALDSNPTIKIFDEFYEMQDWIEEEMQQRMEWIVQHSPYSISEEEYKAIEQEEYTLFQVKEL
tara:strand:- start:691 stop:957 length:267 start_codon:yes stop_codon:yes gene_type:complete